MVFDGSDVGLSQDLNGFLLLNDGSILITIKENDSLPGIGSVDDSDIVRFFPTSLGPNTAGTFTMFFDGSDVGLTTSGEGVDSIGVTPDGRLVISTEGTFNVPGVSGEDEDLLVFNVTSFGSTTSGAFDLYFDGSDVQLGNEDVEGAWIDPVNNDIYLTVSNLFSVTGASGEGADVFVCAPGSLGDTTSCTYSLYWDGSAVGFGGENTDGLSLGSDADIIIPGAGPTPTNTPVPPTPTPTDTPTPTNTPGGPTPTPTDTPTPIPPTPTPTATDTPTPIPPTPTPTATDTPGGPTPTDTPVPPTPTDTPVPPTPTPTNTPLPSADVIHVSGNTGGNVGGVDFKDEDILAYDTGSGTWSMYFDGSDVGIARDLNGFTRLSDGSLLMTFDDPFSLSGIGTVDNSDILQFFPTSLGDNTAGSFSLYFDGSDVGLTTSGENIDAISLAPDGRLVVSTTGNFNVPGASGNDEDLLIFNATGFGSNTSGSFELHFDGSDVDLSNSGEDVGGNWIDPGTGEIYLSTQGNFSVPGVSGASSDIFICAPSSLGSSTSCTFSFYWDGSANGFTPKVDGFFIDN